MKPAEGQVLWVTGEFIVVNGRLKHHKQRYKKIKDEYYMEEGAE
jgi:hypothetical protein